MSRNRTPDRSDETFGPRACDSAVLASESLRTAVAGHEPAPHPKGEERISVFWRVFGGTLVSLAGLVVITVYQGLNGSIHDLRAEISRLNEGRSELIKKDEFNSRLSSAWTAIREHQSVGGAVSALKERAEGLEKQLKAAEDERKELTRELHRLRERQAVLEGRQGAVERPKPDND